MLCVGRAGRACTQGDDAAWSPLSLAPTVRPQAAGGRGGWDAEVVPFRLPPGVQLMLGDVAAGSSTPSMVGKVNAWRAAHPAQGSQTRTLARMDAEVGR